MSNYLKPELTTFAKEKLIAIVRTDSAESALWSCRVLLDAGFKILEIPYTVPKASAVIETIRQEYPQALIGAGTVLTLEEAHSAMAAGASFLVSPVCSQPIVSFGLDNNIPFLPGCMTPSEIYQAWQYGVLAVKFFPASSAGGPDFIRAFHGPFPQIPIMATGGIQKENLNDYLKAGALAVGVGSPLLKKEWIVSRNAAALAELAKAYLAVISQAH